MELSEKLAIVFFLAAVNSSTLAIPTRINFEKCGTKGFGCDNSKVIPGKVDVIYQCNTTQQNILLFLWQFDAPPTIASLTIKDCGRVQLSFSCTGDNRTIQWLKIQNVGRLEIIPSVLTHNPPEVYFENISYIENIPRHTFAQIKQESYKPGCVNPPSDLSAIYFKDVNIHNIDTEAFRYLKYMKTVSWINVSVNRVSVGAIKLHFAPEGSGTLKGCRIGILEPMAFQVVGEGFSVTNSKIDDMWGSSINGTIYDFEFNNNTVSNIQSSAIAILAQNVYIMNNRFENIETGAFKKISPGLLHDSRINFGKLIFVYHYSNNLIESVEDGGIRPDIQAYKNVAAEVTYTHNKLQCSCEGLTWLGADVDLGYGYSVIKDFNTMILDPKNDNMCTFTPCMCFGVRSPSKKNTAAASIF